MSRINLLDLLIQRKTQAVIVVAGFAVLGLMLAAYSSAATSTKSAEAETGQLGGKAATLADPSNKASGGSYVFFSSSNQ